MPRLEIAPRILLVDDNQAIHDDFRKILLASDEVDLERQELEAALFGTVALEDSPELAIDSVYQGQEAIEAVRASQKLNYRYGVAFVDVRMPPGIDGAQTGKQLLEEDPYLQIVICTAYSDYSWREFKRIIGDTDRVLFLKKPFSTVEVRQLASSLRRKWQLSREVGDKLQDLETLVGQRTKQVELVNASLQKEMLERERVENELRHTQKIEAVGRLAAGVGHEINNPLCYVIENLAFVRDEIRSVVSDPESERVCQLVEALDDALLGSDRIAEIVRNIGDFSRKHETPTNAISINEPMETAIKMVRNEIRHRAKLIVDLSDVPRIRGDVRRLEQVFVNLLINAGHACSSAESDHNEIVVRSYEDKKGAVVIEVRDTGCGIDKHQVECVFEPFFTTKSFGKGTGVGLSICHGIVSALGGTIRFESELNQGTTVFVRFPRLSTESSLYPGSAADCPGSVAEIAVPHSVGPGVGVTKAKILIVDDESLILRMLKKVLSDYEVVAADDGAQALELCRAHSFDVVLCDVMMPGMSGQRFYDNLSTMRPEQLSKIVFMTGGAFTEKTQDFLQKMSNCCLRKPFTKAQILSVVDQQLGRMSANQ